MPRKVDKTGFGLLRRIGGEVPAFAARFGSPQPWNPNWLPFSHGRAALAWLLDRQPVRSAIICAYTCPSVPAFFCRRDLAINFFDVAADHTSIIDLARRLPTPRILVLPALFGSPPWLDANALQQSLTPDDLIVVDAAQTAFGHIELDPADGTAVLSCPRKTTELVDGAVLAVSREIHGTAADLEELPIAREAATAKAVARALWAMGDVDLEKQALAYNQRSEESWPDTPHRMSGQSRAMLDCLDREWHTARRRRNRDTLVAALKHHCPFWAVMDGTPFSLPIFVANRNAVLAKLRTQRIFATALWPNARFDPDQHPGAAWIADHLISLPVDQRHEESDMQRVADAVITFAQAPPVAPPEFLRSFIS